MADFGFWFKEGVLHITDFGGYDHMLFLLVLCAPYGIKQLGRLLGLITGFTLGHSLALALSVLGIVNFAAAWIELGIAITILVTALMALLQTRKPEPPNFLPVFLGISFFGLIHGLGFSTLLKSMLGSQTQLLWPLLGFNIGLEVGQLLIVLILLALIFLLERFARVEPKRQIRVYALIAIFLSMHMAWERLGTILNEW